MSYVKSVNLILYTCQILKNVWQMTVKISIKSVGFVYNVDKVSKKIKMEVVY